MFLLNASLIEVLRPKSICFLNQLQGLKIIMNTLHVSESGVILESEFYYGIGIVIKFGVISSLVLISSCNINHITQ